jgi:hypothetical protein
MRGFAETFLKESGKYSLNMYEHMSSLLNWARNHWSQKLIKSDKASPQVMRSSCMCCPLKMAGRKVSPHG